MSAAQLMRGSRAALRAAARMTNANKMSLY
jgi:hypothetical protein